MTILVVDDEPDIKDLFLQRFHREVCAQTLQLAFAYSAQQALDYLARQGSVSIPE